MTRLLFIACSVCTGNPNSNLTRGAIAGVWFLGIVVALLLVSIAGIASSWRRRARSLHSEL